MSAPAARYEPAAGVAHENARAAATIASAFGSDPFHVVLSPGSRSTPLALAFDACPAADVHVVLDERAAAFVALGIGRASGRAAVLLCTSGSAGAHYLPAVIEAQKARVPLLALTADRPAELQACGAPQTIAQARLFGEHVRFQMELPVPDATLDMRWLRNAIAQSRARALTGPVHINAPFREPLWEPALPSAEPPPAARVWHGSRALSPADVAALAGELSQQRGVIVLGPRAPSTIDARALGEAAIALGRALGWPVLADAASGARFGDVIGCAEAIVRHAPSADALAPAMVLRIGMLPTSKVLARWLARHGRTILIDPDGEWHDPDGAADALIIADPAPLCEALARAVADPCDASWRAAWQRAEARVARALASVCREPDWEGAVAHAVVEALPEGTQLHLGSSMPIRDVDAFAPSFARRIDVHVNRGANGIDGAIATALGEALAKGPTVALVGDLSFVHDLDGLAALGELRAPLTIVVVHNGGGGIFRFLPIAHHPTAFERLFATPQRADLAALCRAFDIPHRRIEPHLVGEALASPSGPSVLEVRIDPATNLTRHEQAWARAQRALERGKGA